MAPFYYGWGSSALRLQPLRGGSLLFTIQLNRNSDLNITETHTYDIAHDVNTMSFLIIQST